MIKGRKIPRSTGPNTDKAPALRASREIDDAWKIEIRRRVETIKNGAAVEDGEIVAARVRKLVGR